MKRTNLKVLYVHKKWTDTIDKKQINNYNNGDKKRTKNYSFSFDPFCGEGAWSDGRAAAKGLELGVDDLAVGVNFDLNLMNIKSSSLFLILISFKWRESNADCYGEVLFGNFNMNIMMVKFYWFENELESKKAFGTNLYYQSGLLKVDLKRAW